MLYRPFSKRQPVAIRGSGSNGTCNCRSCQRTVYYTPAQKELRKLAKRYGLRPTPKILQTLGKRLPE